MGKNPKKIGKCIQQLTQSLDQLALSISHVNFTTSMIQSLGQMETQIKAMCQTAQQLRVSEQASDSSRELKVLKQEEDFQKSQNENKNTKRGPYRSYSIAIKRKVIQLHKAGLNYNTISKKMKIPPKNIVRWCKQGYDRKPGAGRKVFDPKMEQKVLKWIKKNFQQGEFINPLFIQNIAKKYSNNPLFIASVGWFKNFIRRNSLGQIYVFK